MRWKEGKKEGRRREGKRRGCRVAASCNELHKRKRSHVILNEGLLRFPSTLPFLILLLTSSFFSSLSHGLSLLPSFLSCVRPACLRFILPPPLPPVRALVGPNLCLSLSLLVWFVGSRLGTVITEYPPLTSGTLVVLSPPRARLLSPPRRAHRSDERAGTYAG